MDFDEFVFDTSVLTQTDTVSENSEELAFLKQLLTPKDNNLSIELFTLQQKLELEVLPIFAQYDFEQVDTYHKLIQQAIDDKLLIDRLSNLTVLDKHYSSITHNMNKHEFIQFLNIFQIAHFLDTGTLDDLYRVLEFLPVYISTGEAKFSLYIINYLDRQIQIELSQVAQFIQLLDNQRKHGNHNGLYKFFSIAIGIPSANLNDMIIRLATSDSSLLIDSSSVNRAIRDDSHALVITPIQKFDTFRDTLEKHMNKKMRDIKTLVSQLNKASLDDENLITKEKALLNDELKDARNSLKKIETDKNLVQQFFEQLMTNSILSDLT